MTFDDFFLALTGHNCFPWQRDLYQRFTAGRFPGACDIPTGLGKTSVIPIWLIALATHSQVMPRRLVYIVNRRTVVDQATNVVETMRKRLNDPDDQNWRQHAPALHWASQQLQGLGRVDGRTPSFV